MSAWAVGLFVWMASAAQARSPVADITLSMVGVTAEPTNMAPDPGLTADVTGLIADSPLLAKIHEDDALSLVLVDITDPQNMKTAMSANITSAIFLPVVSPFFAGLALVLAPLAEAPALALASAALPAAVFCSAILSLPSLDPRFVES